MNKEYYKTKITELCDSYKAIVALSSLVIKENDICSVINLNKKLKQLHNMVLSTIETFDSEDVYKSASSGDFETLPEYLNEFKLLDSYNKLLALDYTKLEPENINDKLSVVKMCLDFDYKEILHAIKLAQILCDSAKYREAIMLAQYLTTVTNVAPPWLVLGKAYHALKMYGSSIEAYRSYLYLNENDKSAEKELDEVYNEMLGIKI